MGEKSIGTCERRIFERLEVNATCILKIKDLEFEAQVVNMSLGGALIELNMRSIRDPLPINKRGEIELVSEENKLSMMFKVLRLHEHSNKRRFAIRFFFLAPTQVESLNSFILSSVIQTD